MTQPKQKARRPNGWNQELCDARNPQPASVRFHTRPRPRGAFAEAAALAETTPRSKCDEEMRNRGATKKREKESETKSEAQRETQSEAPTGVGATRGSAPTPDDAPRLFMTRVDVSCVIQKDDAPRLRAAPTATTCQL